MLDLSYIRTIKPDCIKKGKIKQTLKDTAALRWFVLILVSGLMFGTYWFQDCFAALKPLMESQLGIVSSEFGTLIGVTSIANMFGMIIVGGVILDKWGIRITGVLFGVVATVGAAITALGASSSFSGNPSTHLTIMIIGRIIFGIGFEITSIVVLRTIVKWFNGYELALAMGVSMGFGRLGSALGISFSFDIGDGIVQPAINFAATLIGIGLIMFIVYLMFDVKVDRQLEETEESTIADEDSFRFGNLIKLLTNKSFVIIAVICVTFYASVFPFMMYVPDLLTNKFSFTYNLPFDMQLIVFGSGILGDVLIYICLFIFGISFPLAATNIKNKIGRLISIIIISIVFVGFIYLLKDILSVWLRNGPKVASLIPMGTIFFSPIFGSIVDKKGKAASFMILGSLLLIFAYLSLSVFNAVGFAYLGLLALAVAFSLVSVAIWPSVSKIVSKIQLGTAYAAMFTIQNLGMLAFFWGIGHVLDLANPTVVNKLQESRSMLEAQELPVGEISEKILLLRANGEIPTYDYAAPILMLVVLSVVSIFLAVMLKKADKEHNLGLELPPGT